MNELPDSLLLTHRAYYIPWVDGLNNYSPSVDFAQKLARLTQLPIQVAAPTLAAVPASLRKADVITGRAQKGSGRRRVVLILHPDLKMLQRALPADDSYVVGVEHPAFRLAAWGRSVEAIDTSTGEAMREELPDNVRELYNAIAFNGNNGWFDAPGKRDALMDLTELQDLGALDAESLVAFMLPSKTVESINQLEKLIAKVRAPGKA